MHFSLPSNFESRLELYELDTSACERLAKLWPVLQATLTQAVDKFIEAERQMPSVAAVFQVHAGLIRELEINHMRLLLSGRLDQQYVESCQYVSEQQSKIGLSPRTRMIAGNIVLRAALDALARKRRFSARKVVADGQLIAQAIAFDIATTMTFYQDATLSASEARRKAVDSAIAEFRSTINDTISAVKTVSEALSRGSAEMQIAAKESSQRMNSTAKASDETNIVVQSTAAATDQLSQSINEIGTQSVRSLSLATDAAHEVEVSMNNLSTLSAAVNEIGFVAEMISNIAGQTNLLALNATIEAARAGDSGKGFAVVAAEVKALANQTEKATDGISQHIAAIQAATRELVGQLGLVAHAVKNISSVAGTIEQAVHEQSAATNKIGISVKAVAKYTVQASEVVRTVETSSNRSLGIVQEVVDLTERLSSRAADLEKKVAQFFSSVQAA